MFKATCHASSYVPHQHIRTCKLQAVTVGHMPPNAHKFPWTLGFDDINHGTNAHETGLYWFAVSGSKLSLGSGSDTKEAEEPKSSMALI